MAMITLVMMKVVITSKMATVESRKKCSDSRVSVGECGTGCDSRCSNSGGNNNSSDDGGRNSSSDDIGDGNSIGDYFFGDNNGHDYIEDETVV